MQAVPERCQLLQQSPAAALVQHHTVRASHALLASGSKKAAQSASLHGSYAIGVLWHTKLVFPPSLCQSFPLESLYLCPPLPPLSPSLYPLPLSLSLCHSFSLPLSPAFTPALHFYLHSSLLAPSPLPASSLLLFCALSVCHNSGHHLFHGAVATANDSQRSPPGCGGCAIAQHTFIAAFQT